MRASLRKTITTHALKKATLKPATLVAYSHRIAPKSCSRAIIKNFALVVFEVRNGVERWNADVELKEISPGNWEYGGAIEVDHHIAVR